jgi:hypothetical protein
MTVEEDMAAVLQVCPLSHDDLAGFLACSDDERQALIEAYRDAGVMATPDAWDRLLAVLKTTESFASLAGPIGGAVALAFSLGSKL